MNGLSSAKWTPLHRNTARFVKQSARTHWGAWGWGCLLYTSKRVGFALPYDRSSDQVLVFEAPIDLMSYLTLHRNTPNALAPVSYTHL